MLFDEEWKWDVLLVFFAALSPVVVSIMALPLRLLTFFLRNTIFSNRQYWQYFYIEGYGDTPVPLFFWHVKDYKTWWRIPFLLDLKTWLSLRRPQCYQFFCYSGPYLFVTILVIVYVVFKGDNISIHFVESWVVTPRTPENWRRSFRLFWYMFWVMAAERVIVKPFVDFIPMIMTGPTWLMTCMLVPEFHRDIRIISRIVKGIQRGSFRRDNYLTDDLLHRAMMNLRMTVSQYRRLHLPFRTDFVKLYNLEPILRSFTNIYCDCGFLRTVLHEVVDVDNDPALAMLHGKWPQVDWVENVVRTEEHNRQEFMQDTELVLKGTNV
jgi:lipid-A-disaccharide synthase-like uncharacterized protein